ncbi:hypothetical protein ACFOSD_06200 [Salinispirillum marinum]|uniref:Uncharacterized protein n=2 Tax=Saccharospirillaceae TaxID=255527 RepID=A0ABV8BC61_9GAMM
MDSNKPKETTVQYTVRSSELSPGMRFLVIFCAVVGAVSLFFLVLMPLLGMAFSIVITLFLGFLAVLAGLFIFFILLSPIILAGLGIRALSTKRRSKP